MLLDLHCHTKFSRDNSLEPQAFVRLAKARGLDAVCVTEHDTLEASRPVVALGRAVGLLVLQGVEVSTDRGHLLCYGLQDDGWLRLRGRYHTPAAALAEFAAARGAVLVPAHPFRAWSSNAAGTHVHAMEYITALEVVNGMNSDAENTRAHEAAATLALPGIGGSDSHYEEEVARAATHFPHAIASMADLVAALHAGGYHPVCRTGAAEFTPYVPEGRAPDAAPRP